jgi:hypothetical protein
VRNSWSVAAASFYGSRCASGSRRGMRGLFPLFALLALFAGISIGYSLSQLFCWQLGICQSSAHSIIGKRFDVMAERGKKISPVSFWLLPRQFFLPEMLQKVKPDPPAFP